MYSVKEIYYTLQGEGTHTGRPAIFCRFAGCNLWSGLERDRSKAICQFCDTDFVGIDGPGGGKFKTATDLAKSCKSLWPDNANSRFIVITGGEPMLQVNEELIEALHNEGFEVAIETNGTLPVPRSIDWICVSPKANTKLVQTSGDELKLVYPQETLLPKQMEHLNFKYFYLQPMDSKQQKQNTKDAISYCLKHPQWQLSVQIHKVLGID